MTAKPEKPPAVNVTVKRLLALEPGQACVYYRGDFAADVASSSGVPAYARILEAVERTARELQAAGRIEISERKVWLTAQGQRFRVTEYRALGLADAPAGASSDDDYSGIEPDEAAAA
jgi:hypothetical protein